MIPFITCGTITINLNRVSCICWGRDLLGAQMATIHFSDGEPLHVSGEDAADLSEAVSACEAMTEKRLESAYKPTLYEQDEDVLLDLEAGMLSGPPYSA